MASSMIRAENMGGCNWTRESAAASGHRGSEIPGQARIREHCTARTAGDHLMMAEGNMTGGLKENGPPKGVALLGGVALLE